MADEQPLTFYSGKRIRISWDSRLCIHIGECSYANNELFIGGRDPWCQPDLVSQEQAIEVIKRCPSGALNYTTEDAAQAEQAEASNFVQISYNGPLFIRGDLDIEGRQEDMPAVRYRAALCRCGLSKNKPYCDNSHIGSDFRDAGAIGDAGPGFAKAGGSLTIKCITNGPLLLLGNVTLIASSGCRTWQGSEVALCRCGHSANKPFCDGSHKHVKFTA